MVCSVLNAHSLTRTALLPISHPAPVDRRLAHAFLLDRR
jgi:hypothetical protein